MGSSRASEIILASDRPEEISGPVAERRSKKLSQRPNKASWEKRRRRYRYYVLSKLTPQKKAIDKHGIIEPPKLTTSKPSAVPVAAGGRRYSVSVALPGSIIANAQRLEAKTNLAGQVKQFLLLPFLT